MMNSLKKLAPLTAFALVAGCATIPTSSALQQLPQGANDKAYMALGTEPGWSAEITPGQINYNGNYGDTQIRVPVTSAQPTQDGITYQGAGNGHNVTLAIRYGQQCSDGMSDRLFEHDVTITADGQTYRGCGGAILPPMKLDDTSWGITAINGTALTEEQARQASFQFTDGKVAITVGCNRMSGTYQAASHGMTVGPLMSTRMACPEPLGAWESAISAALSAPLHMRYTPDGNMTLMGTKGQSIALNRSI